METDATKLAKQVILVLVMDLGWDGPPQEPVWLARHIILWRLVVNVLGEERAVKELYQRVNGAEQMVDGVAK